MQSPTDPDSPTRRGVDPARVRRALGAEGAPGARPDLDPGLSALTSLLGDESPTVRAALSEEFQRRGRQALRPLARAAASSDARVRSHARALLGDLEFESSCRDLARYLARPEPELEAGLWKLSALDRADFDARPYLRAPDAMARAVEERAQDFSDPLDRCKVLVHYLGEELGYAGDVDAYTSPDNVLLHRTIERKKGLPLTLCALYAAVARRVGLRTGLLPLPGHVMLRLFGRERNLIVDPFHGGEARTQDSLMEYLAQHGLEFQPVWFQSAPDQDLLKRQLLNLRNSMARVGRVARARRLSRLLPLFEKR